MSLNYVQGEIYYQAGSGSIIGATSVVLTNFTDIYGNVLTMSSFGSKGYCTAEPDTNNEEAFTFTGITANANGTYSLTGVSTALAQTPYTESSGLIRQHAGGTKIVVTDNVSFWNTFGNKQNDEALVGRWTTPVVPSNANDLVNKSYADGLAIAGAPDSSTTVKGIGRVSVAPVSPTIPIFVGDNDPRVPTQGENDALVGTSGTPSSSNKYVTDADTSGTGSVVRSSLISAETYGDGSDGVVTETTRSLTRDMYYTNLTVPNGVTLSTANYRIFVSGTLTISGTGKIDNSGASAVTATAGAATAAGTLTANVAGANGGVGGGGGVTASGGSGGGSGASGGIIAIYAQTISIGASGSITSIGGAGGAGGAGANGGAIPNSGGNGNPGTVGSNGNSSSPSLGVAGTIANGANGVGGTGGNSSNAGQTGGAGGAVTATAGTVTLTKSIPHSVTNAQILLETVSGSPLKSSASAISGSGGGAGASGSGAANTGSGGGGGGGYGGSGGVIILVYHTLTNSGSISVAGGAAGAFGAHGTGATNNGTDGTVGLAGGTGIIYQVAI